MAAPDDPRRLFDKTFDLLKSAGNEVKEGLRRTVEATAVRADLLRLRGQLSDVTKEVGRKAIDVLRLGGPLSAEDVSSLLRKVDDLEDRIAAKERQLGEIEQDEGSTTRSSSSGADRDTGPTPVG